MTRAKPRAISRDGGGADVLRRDDQAAVLAELGVQPLRRQLAAVTADPREADFQIGAFGDGVDAGDRLWRLRIDLLRRTREVERDAHDVGVLDVEQAILVELV